MVVSSVHSDESWDISNKDKALIFKGMKRD